MVLTALAAALRAKQAIEGAIRRRFIRLHGIGADSQYDVYRCYTCGKLLTWNRIRSGATCCIGRVIPGSPTFWEAVRLLIR